MLGDLGSDASTTFASDVSNECNFWYCGSGRLAPHGRWPPPPNHRTGPRSHQCVHRNHQHLRWVHGHPENARHVQVRLPFFFICFVLFCFFSVTYSHCSGVQPILPRSTSCMPSQLLDSHSRTWLLYSLEHLTFTRYSLILLLSPLSSFFLFSFVTHQ